MSLIIYLLLFAIHLLTLMLDISIFFILVRLIQLHNEFNWLVPFDRAGDAIIQMSSRVIMRIWARSPYPPLTERGRLVTAVFILSLAQLFLLAIVGR